MKRFWDAATVHATELGYEIRLDGRPMRLPSGAKLTVRAPPLAVAIAARAQKSLPLPVEYVDEYNRFAVPVPVSAPPWQAELDQLLRKAFEYMEMKKTR